MCKNRLSVKTAVHFFFCVKASVRKSFCCVKTALGKVSACQNVGL